MTADKLLHSFQEMVSSLRSRPGRYAVPFVYRHAPRPGKIIIDPRSGVLSRTLEGDDLAWTVLQVDVLGLDAQYRVFDADGTSVPRVHRCQSKLDFQAAVDVHKVHEFGEFGRIESPRANRRDLHALMLLQEVLPLDECPHRFIHEANEDEIHFGPEVETLEKYLTEEHVIELLRCGVDLSPGGYLFMEV